VELYKITIDGLPPIEADAYELVWSKDGRVKTLVGILPDIPEGYSNKHSWLVEKIQKEE